MRPAAESLQDLVGMVGRAVGQDQLASGEFCDGSAHRGVRLQRRMIDFVYVSEIVVGTHAMLGHHATHRGAIAAVVVLLDPARFLRGYFEPGADELTDPCVDLMPQIDVMRIERVVEVEHPGIDVGESAGRFHDILLVVMPAQAGIQYTAAVERIHRRHGVLDHPLSRVMTAKSVDAKFAYHHGIAKRSALPPLLMSTAAKPIAARPRVPQSPCSLISNLLSRVQSWVVPPQFSALSLNLRARLSASTPSAKLKICFG